VVVGHVETTDTAMKFPAFVKAIDNLVREWATDEPKAQLKVIFDEVRNGTAYELAQMQAKLDKLLPRYHKHLLEQKGESER
jgi:hypothetical protein